MGRHSASGGHLKARSIGLASAAMKASLALSVVLACVVALVFCGGIVTAQDYDDGIEHTPGDLLENVDSLLRNRNFMAAQIKCVRGKMRCDRVGRRIRGIVKELQSKKACVSCNPQERAQMRKVVDYVAIHYTDFWTELNITDDVVRNLE